MNPIPVGQYFEKLVILLKQKFEVFFSVISNTLNIAIEALKNILLLSPHHLYASVVFGLLLSLLIALVLRRKVPRLFIPALIITAILFTGLETWRVTDVNRKITPSEAADIQKLYDELSQVLEAEQQLAISNSKNLLESIDQNLSTLEQDAEVRSIRRNIRLIQRQLENSPINISRIIEGNTETLVSLKSSTFKGQIIKEKHRELNDIQKLWQAIAAKDPVHRFTRDLNRITEPQAVRGLINSSRYKNLNHLLHLTADYYHHAGKESLATLAEQSHQELQIFNPDRLKWYSPAMVILAMTIIAYLIAGIKVSLFALLGLALIVNMQLWIPTMESLALVLAAALFALLIGIPLGIAAMRSKVVDQCLRPILDLMQTMPAFVYLIPAVIFFGLGEVPGAIATLIFSMPPAVRLTTLGIKQVPTEIVEAAQSFGSTNSQMLFKAQLPIALPTILAGVNQTIMLSLSMVVIAGMIGAGGLGSVVLTGITQMKLGLGFEGGLAVVILAIYLDRVTQAMGSFKQ